MSGNAGADMLKMLAKLAVFVIKLLPGLIKMIYKGIMGIIGMFQKKENKSEDSEK